MSEQNDKILVELKNNFENIVSKIRSLKEENENLKIENKKISTELENNIINNNKLEEKYNNIKLAKTIMSRSEDTHEAKLKVNRIVREIDKCIALLNR